MSESPDRNSYLTWRNFLLVLIPLSIALVGGIGATGKALSYHEDKFGHQGMDTRMKDVESQVDEHHDQLDNLEQAINDLRVMNREQSVYLKLLVDAHNLRLEEAD